MQRSSMCDLKFLEFYCSWEQNSKCYPYVFTVKLFQRCCRAIARRYQKYRQKNHHVSSYINPMNKIPTALQSFQGQAVQWCCCCCCRRMSYYTISRNLAIRQTGSCHINSHLVFFALYRNQISTAAPIVSRLYYPKVQLIQQHYDYLECFLSINMTDRIAKPEVFIAQPIDMVDTKF